MDLKLVNQEISEARLYRTTEDLISSQVKNIKIILPKHIDTYMMYKDDKQ